MKEYQRQKNNQYYLPRELYNATVWHIRDYYRLAIKAQAILEESPSPPDGQPSKSDCKSIVETKALKRDMYTKKIKAIDNALKTIPPEYRIGVWQNIMCGSRYPEDASKNTYGRHKAKFIYKVAENLKMI